MVGIVRWSPWTELDAMERRVRRLFEDVGIAPAPAPSADVYETDGELVIEVEAPGFKEDEVSIEVTDDFVRVTGQRKEEREKEEKTFHLRERLEASFERRFSLPPEADTEQVKATFKDGVLEVHIPKKAEQKPRQVEITKS